jgi:hypothetical protein
MANHKMKNILLGKKILDHVYGGVAKYHVVNHFIRTISISAGLLLLDSLNVCLLRNTTCFMNIHSFIHSFLNLLSS